MVAIRESSPYQRELIELLTSNPQLEDILNFHLSDEADARLSRLLEANRQGQLTPDEATELDEYALIEHLITMAKIRALEKQTQP